MVRKDEQETTISWMGTDDMAEVYTTDPTIIRRLEKMELEETTNGNIGRTFAIAIDRLFGAKPRSAAAVANRPVRTHEQKVTKLYQLRKGKTEKAQGKPLTKKQDKEVLAYCEARVTAKEQDETSDE